MMDQNYSVRGYLLPAGCKDLIDVIKLKDMLHWPPEPTVVLDSMEPCAEILVAAQISVEELATKMNEKPFRVIATLMQMGIFASIHQQIDFEVAATVARLHGFRAKRTSVKD